MSDSPRIGIVGLGWWSARLATAIREVDGAHLAKCYAHTPVSRDAFAKEHDCGAVSTLDEMLEDPGVDALLLATPHSGSASDRNAGRHGNESQRME